MYPTGEQYELRAGDYAATVTQVGAVLRGLRYGARDLVRGFRAEHAMPLYRGAVLAPWPNRVADGRYSFASSAHQLPVNEIERGCALHGLVAWDGWLLSRRRESSLRLEHRLWPRPGYPFLLALDVSYELQEQLGLSITLSARNDGMDPPRTGPRSTRTWWRGPAARMTGACACKRPRFWPWIRFGFSRMESRRSAMASTFDTRDRLDPNGSTMPLPP